MWSSLWHNLTEKNTSTQYTEQAETTLTDEQLYPTKTAPNALLQAHKCCKQNALHRDWHFISQLCSISPAQSQSPLRWEEGVLWQVHRLWDSPPPLSRPLVRKLKERENLTSDNYKRGQLTSHNETWEGLNSQREQEFLLVKTIVWKTICKCSRQSQNIIMVQSRFTRHTRVHEDVPQDLSLFLAHRDKKKEKRCTPPNFGSTRCVL